MRITGGTYRNRKIAFPEGNGVRPASDRVRQAVFNILLSSYGLPADAIVLDAFCGTGAYGLEALSRGAASCVFMEKVAAHLAICQKNVETVDAIDKSIFRQVDVLKPGMRPHSLDPADLVFLDPPYKEGLAIPALKALVSNSWIAPEAVCVVETEKGITPEAAGFTLDDTRTYGHTRITMLRYSM